MIRHCVFVKFLANVSKDDKQAMVEMEKGLTFIEALKKFSKI